MEKRGENLLFYPYYKIISPNICALIFTDGHSTCTLTGTDEY